MTIRYIDFSSIQNGIKALQAPLPKSSLFTYFWRQDPSQTLEQLSLDLRNKVVQASDYASGTENQKIKYAVCEQLLQLNFLIQNESKQGALKKLIEESPAVRQKIDAMSAIVNNALVRGDNCQKVWGNRFCTEEALLDRQWEEFMRSTRQLPVNPVGLFKYYILFAATLFCTQLLSIITPRNWWDKITTTGTHQADLYLGALPLITPFHNDLKDLKKIGIEAVLSLVEPFENNSLGWVSSPVTPAQWNEAGIKQLQIPMEDFGTGPISDVEMGVEFIRWNLINNRSIYVHCKAGRGRSALVLLAYLIKYENLSADEAFVRMRSTRPHAGFEKGNVKMQTLREYEKRVRY